jgi:hypothetical protein
MPGVQEPSYLGTLHTQYSTSEGKETTEICMHYKYRYIARSTVAKFFIMGERFVITGQLQAAEVLSKLSTMNESRLLLRYCSDR